MYLVVEQPGEVPVGAVALDAAVRARARRRDALRTAIPLPVAFQVMVMVMMMMAPDDAVRLERTQLLDVHVVHFGDYVRDPVRRVPTTI